MEATATESPYMTYAEAAAYCKVNKSTLWRACRHDKLQESGPGMAVRFHKDELDRWMNSRNRK